MPNEGDKVLGRVVESGPRSPICNEFHSDRLRYLDEVVVDVDPVFAELEPVFIS